MFAKAFGAASGPAPTAPAPTAPLPSSPSRHTQARPSLPEVMSAITTCAQEIDEVISNIEANNLLLSGLHSLLNSYFSASTLHLGYAYEQRASSFRYKWKPVYSYVTFPPSNGAPTLKIDRNDTVTGEAKTLHTIALDGEVFVSENLEYGDVRVVVQHAKGYVELR